ncbi:probable glucuronosyltransferase GUT1 [Trifolium pratense]|uniref:probable glucuronosyltransferase GUT1 n=1 Tax=Trifolium pratense TaxID=57577 RepID=UPI001E692ABB|nr:probable glucuronosyltransferase GUT1 [Trifolium pratense]
MWSSNSNNKSRTMHHHHQHHPLCTRTHQIGALLLVIATFFFTRLLDAPCRISPTVSSQRKFLLLPESQEVSIKIYVYDVNEIDGLNELLKGRDGKIAPEACLKGQWGSQVKIHKLLLESRFRTKKKEEADLFFVPSYVKCARMMGGLNDKEINNTFVKVISQMPYFRLSGGRNHIFVFPSGAGAHLFKSWATYINRSIILTPEGDRTDKRDTSAFNTWKDIIIPGNVEDGMTKTGSPMIQPLPLSKRKYLANYLGRAQGKAGRLQLIELSKQFPEKLECPDLKFSGGEKLGRKDYFEHLRNSKFCLAPRGESSWTLRFYESFFVECVPVILSDQIELPFQNVIDYSQISIKWPSSRIGPELLEYLESIPDKDIEAIIARGRQVRCMWVYASDSESCSAMRGIMWELQRKVRQFHQSAETFWLHNGSFVNRNLVEFSKWKLPVPLP